MENTNWPSNNRYLGKEENTEWWPDWASESLVEWLNERSYHWQDVKVLTVTASQLPHHAETPNTNFKFLLSADIEMRWDHPKWHNTEPQCQKTKLAFFHVQKLKTKKILNWNCLFVPGVPMLWWGGCSNRKLHTQREWLKVSKVICSCSFFSWRNYPHIFHVYCIHAACQVMSTSIYCKWPL